MRGLLLLVTVVLILPTAWAQEAEAFASDPAGDVVLTPGEESVSGQGEIDLRSLAVMETEQAVVIEVTVEDAGAAVNVPRKPSLIDTFFTHNEREFRARASLGFGSSIAYRDDPGAEWSALSYLSRELTGNVIGLAIPRDLLADASGAAPFPSRVLSDFYVVGSNSIWLSADTVIAMRDRMPDAGVSTNQLAFKHGLAQTGDARLHADVPMRMSNGEATTYVFSVNASNVGAEARSFTLRANAPAAWDVVLPVTVLDLAPGANQTLPVIVSTAFAHQHGGSDKLLLEMEAADGSNHVGRIELGVTYADVPQPAGHHDTVYFHSRDSTQNKLTDVSPGGFAYMNTLAEDPLDAGIPVRAYRSDFWTAAYMWRLALNPGLQMGLDGVVGGAGFTEADIRAPLLLAGDQVVMELLVATPAGRSWDLVELANGTTTLTEDVRDGTVRVEIPWTMGPAGDLVPFESSQNLWLQIRIVTDRPTPDILEDRPWLLASSTKLPLLEYHDPTDDLFFLAEAPRLDVDERIKVRNPGAVANFEVTVRNPSEEAATYLLDLRGPAAATAAMDAPNAITVRGGEQRLITISSTAPADALDGTQWPLLLDAYRGDNDAIRSIIQLVVEVDGSEEHATDAAVQASDEDRQSPAAPFPLALLAAVVLRRRH